MDRNNRHVVTPPSSSSEEALALLDHADHVEAEIIALRGASERSTNARIADQNNEIGSTFKRAEVLSNLAIAEAIDRLAKRLPPPVEVSLRPGRPGDHFLTSLTEGDPHRC